MIDKPHTDVREEARGNLNSGGNNNKMAPGPVSESIVRDAVPYPGDTFIILHKATNRPIALPQDGGTLKLREEPLTLPNNNENDNIFSGTSCQVSLSTKPSPSPSTSNSNSNMNHDSKGKARATPGNSSTIEEGNDNNPGIIHWLCVERNGWLGFRTVGNGAKYLGQSPEDDNRRTIDATETQQTWWECFCARKHPRGGYVLMSPIEEDKVEPWLCKLLKVEVDHRAGGKLALREDGGALWEFIKVDIMN